MVCCALGAVLLLGCFTTACQPTPAVPPVVNRAQGLSPEMMAEPLPEGQLKELDAPEHWKETLYRQDGRIEVSADVDVRIPENLTNTPVVKLEQVPFPPERMAEVIKYFVGNSKLYKPLPMTKLEGMIQLKKIESGEGSFSQFDEDTRKLMAKKLEELIELAPDEAEKEYTDVKLGLPYVSENTTVLNTYYGEYKRPQEEKYSYLYAETGEEYEPSIITITCDSAAGMSSVFALEYPGRILSASYMEYLREWHQMYRELKEDFVSSQNEFFNGLNDVMAKMTETPEQALAAAQKALDDLGASDMKLDSIEKGIWAPQQPQEWDELSPDMSKVQGGYYLLFVRSSGQLVGYRSNYGGMNAGDMPQYTPPFRMETIEIFVSNGKIRQFSWKNMSQPVETVAANTNLLPFSEITKRLADFLSYNYEIIENQNGDPVDDSVLFEITDVQLRANNITAKNDVYKVWMVPSWLFTFKVISTDEFGEQTVQPEYPCEINALDGGIIIPFAIQ